MYVFDCTIWGFHPLGKPAELTAQYLILNLKSYEMIKCLLNKCTKFILSSRSHWTFVRTTVQSVFTLSVSQSVSQVDQSSLQVMLARQVGFGAIHGI